jgi:hypothetical protein
MAGWCAARHWLLLSPSSQGRGAAPVREVGVRAQAVNQGPVEMESGLCPQGEAERMVRCGSCRAQIFLPVLRKFPRLGRGCGH